MGGEDASRALIQGATFEMILLTLTQKVDAADAILGFYVEWLDRMARRVDRLQVIALEKGAFDLPDNVEVISLGKEDGAGAFRMLLRFNRALLRLCRRARPDAILAHMVPKYVLYALPLARIFGIPIDLWYTHKGVDKYLRMAHPFIRHAFTASKESFRLPSAKRQVMGHGINTDRFKPGPDDARRGMLTVGRITPSKDQEVLIRAVALLRDRGLAHELQTRIVGEPLLDSDRLYLARMKKLVEEQGLTELVRFAGAVPHAKMRDCYRESRIMVNASHTGSVDKVVLEAMATGAVPLTCNESFVPLLGDLADRLVFEKGNALDLSTRMADLLSLEASGQEALAARLRRIVEDNHNLDRLMDGLIRKMSP
jgi:glycosyltransferase involved in cell wall biosynthesis